MLGWNRLMGLTAQIQPVGSTRSLHAGSYITVEACVYDKC